MTEMASTGEVHRHAVFVTGSNHLFVVARAARLDNGLDAGFCRFIDTITKREERVGGHNATLTASPGFVCGDERGIQTAHLSRANADNLASLREDNCVGFDMFTDAPGEF